MDADDAWSAELKRLFAIPDPDPLALDEVTAERLLDGDLRPDQAPSGYAEVAELLAAMVAAPSPGELVGQEAALAELQAATRARRARTLGAGKPARRRRVGLVVAVAVGALSIGGIAAAATGNLPDPIRDSARSIFTTEADAIPIPSHKPGRQPVPRAGATDAPGATTDDQGPKPARQPGTTTMTGAVKDDLCRASEANKVSDGREKMDAAAFKALAAAAGGVDKVASYCQRSHPGGTATNGQGKQAPPRNKPGHGQGGPPASPHGGHPKPARLPPTGPQR